MQQRSQKVRHRVQAYQYKASMWVIGRANKPCSLIAVLIWTPSPAVIFTFISASRDPAVRNTWQCSGA